MLKKDYVKINKKKPPIIGHRWNIYKFTYTDVLSQVVSWVMQAGTVMQSEWCEPVYSCVGKRMISLTSWSHWSVVSGKRPGEVWALIGSWFCNMSSDWLAALLPANQKPCCNMAIHKQWIYSIVGSLLNVWNTQQAPFANMDKIYSQNG